MFPPLLVDPLPPDVFPPLLVDPFPPDVFPPLLVDPFPPDVFPPLLVDPFPPDVFPPFELLLSSSTFNVLTTISLYLEAFAKLLSILSST